MKQRSRSCRAFQPQPLNPLEDRRLLAIQPFAVIQGSLPAGGGGQLITIHIDPASFQLPKGHVLLTFVAHESAGQSLTIGPVKDQAGHTPRGEQTIASGGRIASLGSGTYTFPVGVGQASGADFIVNVGLTGDVNGDFHVTRADVRSIRSLLGQTSHGRSYVPGDDLDADNRIGTRDLVLASRSLGDATALRPLTVSLAPQQPAPESHLVRVVARSQPGALVTFLQPGVQGVDQMADAGGQADFTALVPVGTTTLSAVASDRFGQRVTATQAVQRAPLTNYLGAAFEPYVKQWNGQAPNAMIPFFNSYTSGNASVANQIALVAPTFPQIATYSAGYAPYYPTNQPFNMVDSNWQNAPAAAAYNQEQGKLALTVSQGIFQQEQNGSIANASQDAEVADAFQDAANANATFAGTVTRLIFTNEYITSAATTDQVNTLITANKQKAHDMGLEVGVRSETFGQLTDPNSPYLPQLQSLIKNVDFIMCNLYPSQPAEQQGIAASVNEVASRYAAIKAAALALNPSIEVLIGETGWPSQGVSFNDPDGTLNTVANEHAYFNAIGQWANANQVQVMYFEAIDEPWKSNQNNTNPSAPKGFMGAEGHYGVWSYTTSNDSGSFVAKWTIGS
jgi:exo-beta-1,3-glucanase (GH17 family)